MACVNIDIIDDSSTYFAVYRDGYRKQIAMSVQLRTNRLGDRVFAGRRWVCAVRIRAGQCLLWSVDL